ACCVETRLDTGCGCDTMTKPERPHEWGRGRHECLRHGPLTFIFFLLGRDLGAWDHVFVGGPVAQVDDAAALAAEREIGVALGDSFFANRASHHTATRGEMLMNAEVAGGGAGSVGSSSVPTTS